MLALPVALAASALVVGPTIALRKPIESQMTTIKTIRKNAGGKDGLFESFMDRERGPSQHCLAFDDKDTSCALGYGHLGRLALGGYAVITALPGVVAGANCTMAIMRSSQLSAHTECASICT